MANKELKVIFPPGVCFRQNLKVSNKCSECQYKDKARCQEKKTKT